MDTYIVYFDETGDDGNNTSSSSEFVLTSIYINANDWQENYETIRKLRKDLKEEFGLHIKQEIHTKHLVRDKGFYRQYNWTDEQRRSILVRITNCIANLDIKITNVIIDKKKISNEDYHVLQNALTYNIQRIENTAKGEWNYLIITDEGRLAPMRKTARLIRSYNPVASHYGGVQNIPIKGLVEDILSKDSSESYFIQLCDFISFFSDLYYRVFDKRENLPKRVERIIEQAFVKGVFETLKKNGVLNLKATNSHIYGFVVYPK